MRQILTMAPTQRQRNATPIAQGWNKVNLAMVTGVTNPAAVLAATGATPGIDEIDGEVYGWPEPIDVSTSDTSR